MLKDSCLITSLILLGQLVWSTFRDYRPFKRKENWIPGFSVFTLLLAGIRNVRERLEKQCGGTLTLFSHPGAGTTFTVFIPEAGQDKQGGDA